MYISFLTQYIYKVPSPLDRFGQIDLLRGVGAGGGEGAGGAPVPPAYRLILLPVQCTVDNTRTIGGTVYRRLGVQEVQCTVDYEYRRYSVQ